MDVYTPATVVADVLDDDVGFVACVLGDESSCQQKLRSMSGLCIMLGYSFGTMTVSPFMFRERTQFVEDVLQSLRREMTNFYTNRHDNSAEFKRIEHAFNYMNHFFH